MGGGLDCISTPGPATGFVIAKGLLSSASLRGPGAFHVRHFFDDLLELGIGGDGVAPNLVGARSEIDFRVAVVVEQARLLVVQIVDALGGIAFEEGLVGADDFGVFVEPATHARPEAENALDAVGGQE